MKWPVMLFAPLGLQLCSVAFAQAINPQDSPAATPQNYRRIAAQVERSLRDDDLQKLFPAAVDPQGGFFENFAMDWTHRAVGPGGDSTRDVVYQSRLTWLAAQAAMRYPDQSAAYLAYTRHGARFLAEKQWDKNQGGFWWSVDVSGQVARSKNKHLYGNAFAIYALAAAYQATHDQADLDQAKTAFQWLEDHAHDAVNGGYFEQLRADGSHVSPGEAAARQDDVLGAAPGQKSMNAHIHILEALTGLLQVWPDPLLKKRTDEVYQICLTKIYAEPGYLRQFFSPDWTAAPGADSFGHDIESAFLFTETAAALGKSADPACWTAARALVDHCLKVGFDATSGSLNSEGPADGNGTFDRSRIWWVQAESLNALLLMHERFGKDDARYWNAFLREWDFIRTYQIDHKNGGWFNALSADNTPLPSKLAKTDAWTEGYHQGRAMMRVIDRLNRLASR
jgi:mannobiose 2-epimerase